MSETRHGAASVVEATATPREMERPEGPDLPGERRPPIILIVEDDVGDRILLERAFEDCQGAVQLRFATTGEEAIEYLFRLSKSNRGQRAALVLLDLNVAGVDGRSILREIRKDEVLRPTPVVVFTGSEDRRDVYESYDLGANSFLTKPDSPAGYQKVVRILEAYWLRRAQLPLEGPLG